MRNLVFLIKNSIAGPSIEPGRHGSSIHLPNVNVSGNNSLTLATLGTCLAEIERCTNGMTLAFWVKGPQSQVSTLPNFLSSSSVTIFNGLSPTGFLIRFVIQESAARAVKYWGNVQLKFDEWHLLAVTYSTQFGAKFYLNGCPLKMEAPTLISNSRVASYLIIGCNKYYMRCVHGNFDDLRIWTSEKDKDFIWMLWSI